MPTARRFFYLWLTMTMTVPVLAGSPVVALLLEGDAIEGVGSMTRIDAVAINNDGSWLVEVDTDAAAATDVVIVKDGVVLLREGQALDAPEDATISSFDSINLSNNGHSGWNIFLDDTVNIFDDSGVFLDGQLVIQEGTASAAPELTSGTPYIGWFEATLNDAGQMLMVASVDDSAITSSVDRALIVATVGKAGGLLSESARYLEGDVLPGQADAVADFGTSTHQVALGADGAIMFIADLSGDTAFDSAIYLDELLLAQEGMPSPVAGRTWASLAGAVVTMANATQYAYRGNLAGDSATNAVIVKNGVVFVQEGMTLPSITPFSFTGFSSTGPIDLSTSGQLLWYGEWNDATANSGLFLDDELIVQEGVTTAAGSVIANLASGAYAFALSDNGRWVAFEATLADGRDGVFALEVDTAPLLVASDPPSEAIDARQPQPIGGGAMQGWDSVVLVYDPPLPGVVPQDVIITETGGDAFPPAVASVTQDGGEVIVAFDGPLEPGTWTTVGVMPVSATVRLGYLPADVDGDATSGPLDILALIDHLNGVALRPDYATDLNRSGITEPQDILRAIDLLNGAGVYDAWNGVSLP